MNAGAEPQDSRVALPAQAAAEAVAAERAAASHYRRTLPSGQIGFSSADGRTLFGEALAAGTMGGYFALAEQFHTQSEPSFCGLGSLVIVLNALAIDPGRTWKGAWRWFAEDLLDCCRPLDEIKRDGITLGEFVCLARCNGAQAELPRPPETSLDNFREVVERCCRGVDGAHLVVSYDRATLGQTGSGHFSPLGGYHRERDLVLLLDVARFKYPPHWVPLEQVWRAMHAVDSATGRSRGFVTMRKGAVATPTMLNVVSELCTWHGAASLAVQAYADTTSGRWAFDAAPPPVRKALSSYKPLPDGAQHTTHRNQLIEAVRASPLFAEVATHVIAPVLPEIVTVLLYAAPDALLASAPEPAERRISAHRAMHAASPVLRVEVDAVRAQLEALLGYCQVQ